MERCRRDLPGRALHGPDDERSIEARVRVRLPGRESSLIAPLRLIGPRDLRRVLRAAGNWGLGEVEVANPPAGRWTAVSSPKPASSRASPPTCRRARAKDSVERKHLHLWSGRQHRPILAQHRTGPDRLRAPLAHQFERLRRLQSVGRCVEPLRHQYHSGDGAHHGAHRRAGRNLQRCAHRRQRS